MHCIYIYIYFLYTYTYKNTQILRLFRFFNGEHLQGQFLEFEKGFNGQLFTVRDCFRRRFFHFEMGPKNKWLEDVFPIEIVTF